MSSKRTSSNSELTVDAKSTLDPAGFPLGPLATARGIVQPTRGPVLHDEDSSRRTVTANNSLQVAKEEQLIIPARSQQTPRTWSQA